ncbi:MAG TPA: hypothetical protein VMG38_03750 [Trebonia sp.]|nr:hypothetical protein [Trebonia sp.]
MLTPLAIRQKVLLPRTCWVGWCLMSRQVKDATRACPTRTSTRTLLDLRSIPDHPFPEPVRE